MADGLPVMEAMRREWLQLDSTGPESDGHAVGGQVEWTHINADGVSPGNHPSLAGGRGGPQNRTAVAPVTAVRTSALSLRATAVVRSTDERPYNLA